MSTVSPLSVDNSKVGLALFLRTANEWNKSVHLQWTVMAVQAGHGRADQIASFHFDRRRPTGSTTGHTSCDQCRRLQVLHIAPVHSSPLGSRTQFLQPQIYKRQTFAYVIVTGAARGRAGFVRAKIITDKASNTHTHTHIYIYFVAEFSSIYSRTRVSVGNASNISYFNNGVGSYHK